MVNHQIFLIWSTRKSLCSKMFLDCVYWYNITNFLIMRINCITYNAILLHYFIEDFEWNKKSFLELQNLAWYLIIFVIMFTIFLSVNFSFHVYRSLKNTEKHLLPFGKEWIIFTYIVKGWNNRNFLFFLHFWHAMKIVL